MSPDRCGDGDGRAHENVHQGLVLAGRGTRPPGASWCRECISLSRRRFRPLLSRAGWAFRRERGRPHPTRGGYGAPFHSARRAGQRVPEQRALHHQGRPRPDPAVQGRPGHPRLHRRLIGTTGAVRPTGHSNCCRFWRSGRIVRVGTPDALGGFRVIPRFWRRRGGVRGGTILPERHVPPRTGSAGEGSCPRGGLGGVGPRTGSAGEGFWRVSGSVQVLPTPDGSHGTRIRVLLRRAGRAGPAGSGRSVRAVPGLARLGPGVRSGDWLKRSCTFDQDLSSEDPRNHAETSQRSTPVKSSHVQSDPLCTWENITRKPKIRKIPGIARKTRNWPARAPSPNVQLHPDDPRRPVQPENDPHQGTRPSTDSPALRPRERPAPPGSPGRPESGLPAARTTRPGYYQSGCSTPSHSYQPRCSTSQASSP